MLIIFDFWRTIAQKPFSLSTGLQEEFSLHHLDDYKERFQRELSTKEYPERRDFARKYLTLFELHQTEEHAQRIYERFDRIIRESFLFPGMKELLTTLSEKHMLAILSNGTKFESVVLQEWEVGKLFKKTFFSCETGYLKPNP